ncbi:MAG: T9SS C-terminal target domain-containing protein, partial [Ignavibacteriae bacterium]
YRNGINYPNVYGQRYDTLGNKIGGNFRINEVLNTSQLPRIALNKDGSFIVAFLGGTTSSPKPYMQRYNRFGNTIGGNQRVDDDSTNGRKGHTDIASDGKGYFVIAWDDYRFNPTIAVIYYQVYDTSGNKVGINQRADVNWGPDKGATKTAMQTDGKFIINWIDDRTTYGLVYCQRFNKNGIKIGTNFPVALNTYYGCGSIYSILLYNLRMYSTWNDPRNGNWDIFCNVRSFTNPDSVLVIVPNKTTTLKEFKLYPIYPNPFNPIAKIKFEIPNEVKSQKLEVRLVIYDVLGREAAVLVHDILSSGSYKVQWNAVNYSSGLYFIKLTTESGYSAVQKIILMK